MYNLEEERIFLKNLSFYSKKKLSLTMVQILIFKNLHTYAKFLRKVIVS